MAELKDDIKFFQVMPKNQENYRAIKIDNLWFIDSLQFMQASLDSLVKQEVSVTNVDDLKIINQARAILNPDGSVDVNKRKFFLQKGLVPWCLVTNWDDLSKTRKFLPLDKELYWSDINESYPPEEDIKRAGDFYTTFGCKNIIGFITEYCEMDVIQLAQVFMNFRKKIWDFARIDVLKFVGLASAAYAIFQKKSKCEIGMVTDESMLRFVSFFKKIFLFSKIFYKFFSNSLIMGGIRGGLSFIGSKRIVDSCPTHNPNSQTLYIDANNLVTNTELTTLVSVHLKVIIASFF